MRVPIGDDEFFSDELSHCLARRSLSGADEKVVFFFALKQVVFM
jgi:hypothetical protein